MAGLDAAGGAMKFVGFASLMKVMMSGEMWGFLFAGFVMANICMGIESVSSATLPVSYTHLDVYKRQL